MMCKQIKGTFHCEVPFICSIDKNFIIYILRIIPVETSDKGGV